LGELTFHVIDGSICEEGTRIMAADVDPLMLDVPLEMTTPRLLMRPPQHGEGAAINAAVRESIAQVARWMPWANPTPEPAATERWCREAASKFISREGIHYVIRLKDDAQIIGVCGMHRFDWKGPMIEIGYWLRTSHCGRGYMTEAVGRLVQMAFDDLGASRVEIRCDDSNQRSGRVAERLGFKLDGVLRCDSRGVDKELRDTRVYSMIAADRAGSKR
jgi:RimJ/RimL family protein N-acetyltransferase